MSSEPSLGRVDSMDQFRGFTVLSMFIVNFVHHMAAIGPFWKHNDNYVTFADWIMPGFIFAVGFSYRLTVLKRLQKYSAAKTYFTYFRRSLALILVSLMLYGFGGSFRSWDDFFAKEEIQVKDESGQLQTEEVNNTFQFVMQLIKSNLWEVLSIIAVCQIFVMPVIARGSLVRFLVMIGLLVAHVLISVLFNWAFVHGDQSNWMVQLWQTGDNRSWDGGFFGIISWSVAMLAGTLVYDILASNSRGNAGGKIFLFAAVFMIIGYVLSCGTRFYDIPLDEPRPEKYSPEPMIPDFSKAAGRGWTGLLAEPPFVMPPQPDQQSVNDRLKQLEEMEAKTDLDEEQKKELTNLRRSLQGVHHYEYGRQWNYWMMYKRMVSVSFILFATGVAIAIYALFVLLTDIAGLHVGVFRTFGMHPLAAYAIHHVVVPSMENLAPNNATLWYCWFITFVFMAINYLFVRHLEKHNIYIRL